MKRLSSFLFRASNPIPSEFEHLLTCLAAIYMVLLLECTKYDKVCNMYYILVFISKCTKLRAEDSLWHVDELQGGGWGVNLGTESCSFYSDNL